jgi:hypothetical protein
MKMSFFFRSKIVKTVFVSFALVCCLAGTTYTSYLFANNISQADVINIESSNNQSLTQGKILAFKY